MEHAPSFIEILHAERCLPLQSALIRLHEYIEGSRTLKNGEKLGEVLGDYHAHTLWQDIAHHYGVRQHGPVITVDAKKVAAIAQGQKQVLFEDLSGQMNAFTHDLLSFPDVRDIDMKRTRQAMNEVLESSVSAALAGQHAR